jgi:transcriptional regulator NrdR family protein
MKILVCNNHNRAEEVITHVEEDLSLAKLIRRGADKDLVQVQKTIEDLSQKLVVSFQRFATLWKSFKTVAKLLRTSEDDART